MYWEEFLSILYNEKISLVKTFSSVVQQKITESLYTQVNKVVPLSILSAKVTAKMIKEESFIAQKEVLSSVPMEVQRLVLNQLMILCYEAPLTKLAAFYLTRNDFYVAHQWADKSWFNGSIPSSYLKLSACLGPAFIKYPRNNSLTFELAQCK